MHIYQGVKKLILACEDVADGRVWYSENRPLLALDPHPPVSFHHLEMKSLPFDCDCA
jgi:transposase InsO family protein